MAKDALVGQGLRSVQQLSMLRLWERWRGKDELPRFRSVPSEQIASMIDRVMFCDIHATGAEGKRLMIRYHGSEYEKIYQRNCVGKYLEEVLAPAMRDKALATYAACIETRSPQFSVSVVRKGEGPEIRYERLLLPFRNGGATVERIATFISLFSEANGFDVRDVATGELVPGR